MWIEAYPRGACRFSRELPDELQGGKSSYFRAMARCASLPPNQTHGIARTTSASGYHFGPNSGPLFQVATVPAIAASRPMTPSVQTWPIGLLGARRAVI